jgi:predicted O-methyltransferase YrrM
LNDDRSFYAYNTIEARRAALVKDSTVLTIEDFGAGSTVTKSNKRKVSDIAKSALKPKKFGQLLFRMANYYSSKTILELGTSLGITTSYLASGNLRGAVYTFEGAKEVAAVAKQTFAANEVKNIELIQGNFDLTLPKKLTTLPVIDLAFLDGNHRKEPTLRYFQQLLPKTNEDSILVFDDIHWSEEMEAAWEEIKQHPSVTLTIDLFFIGLVFFRKEQKVKQHFVVRF